LAVELAKLSLWLTCIAVDEPLSFLDHHLCCGNALLGARAQELRRLPFISEENAQKAVFEIGETLTEAIREVIKQNVDIEMRASTEMEIVKMKEAQWKKVRAMLKPFLTVADTWISAFDDLQIDHLDYRTLALAAFDPNALTPSERAHLRELRESLKETLSDKKKLLQPFHWQLEFPDVFYLPDGLLRPESNRGFDAILGNPPYVSTHTSSEEKWRVALGRRAGSSEDLYVHFADLGFALLRPGGFIVSDTFFTLTGKLPMRELIQGNRLTHLGQCRPFDATVDAALFVASKSPMGDEDTLIFVQASFETDSSKPDKELESLDISELEGRADELGLRHTSKGCLRLHQVPAKLYRGSVRRAFFEPVPAAIELYQRFNEPVKQLITDWWDRIESSNAFSDNVDSIRRYQASLKPGDVTLVGLIAEGAQGMRTGNNGRFLGYLDGTPQARVVQARRERLTRLWLNEPNVRRAFLDILKREGGDSKNPTADVPAWEACVEKLKAEFDAARILGFGRTDLYRVVSPELVATPDDFLYTWTRRKSTLLGLWQSEAHLDEFWEQSQTGFTEIRHETLALKNGKVRRDSLRAADDLPDAAFCELCLELDAWWRRENERHSTGRPRRPLVPRTSLGLHSRELYPDPADAPRIATIYNGLSGHAQWVPYRKGDPAGNRWSDNDPLFINWSSESVQWLSTASSARWQGHSLFFTPGVTWTAVANHVAMKARYQEPCVFDADSMRLTPRHDVFDPLAFLSLLNSDVVSFFKMKFVKHTQKWEIGDLRLLPVVMPTSDQSHRLAELARQAMLAKQLSFTGRTPPDDMVSFVRGLARDLLTGAPAYLQPSAQAQLLVTFEDCLNTIGLAVNWEAEMLYGVEGLGPFDEF
jgi:hypothetical protein